MVEIGQEWRRAETGKKQDGDKEPKWRPQCIGKPGYRLIVHGNSAKAYYRQLFRTTKRDSALNYIPTLVTADQK